jgi:branched-chain amino acid transport system substrate-binding protein
MRTLRTVLATAVVASLLAACTQHASTTDGTVRVGAIYPLSGSQGPGGLAEFRGVQIAADMANASGGIDGHPVRLVPVDAPAASTAASAVELLHRQGVRFVVGSYGSTISEPAATASARDGMLFWETGAVGMMAAPDRGSLVFRVAPSGATLGRDAIAFMASVVAKRLHRSPRSLRFVVANVDDLYGNEVADGAVKELHRRHFQLVGRFPYDAHTLRPDVLARRIAAVHPDILFASAYVEDGVAVRRALVREHVRLLAAIGSSSSYCMPAFGRRLGTDAVGLFASDKPDAGVLDPASLTDGGRLLLAHANDRYRARYHSSMSAPALAGFSAAWALFRWTMPKATSLTPAAVGDAAQQLRVPQGGLPNGSGVAFGPPGTAQAGQNLRAASVIWEWVNVDHRVVVWPPRFATCRPTVLRLAA